MSSGPTVAQTQGERLVNFDGFVVVNASLKSSTMSCPLWRLLSRPSACIAANGEVFCGLMTHGQPAPWYSISPWWFAVLCIWTATVCLMRVIAHHSDDTQFFALNGQKLHSIIRAFSSVSWFLSDTTISYIKVNTMLLWSCLVSGCEHVKGITDIRTQVFSVIHYVYSCAAGMLGNEEATHPHCNHLWRCVGYPFCTSVVDLWIGSQLEKATTSAVPSRQKCRDSTDRQ
jgi:hypothetical protein